MAKVGTKCWRNLAGQAASLERKEWETFRVETFLQTLPYSTRDLDSILNMGAVCMEFIRLSRGSPVYSHTPKTCRFVG